MASNTFWKCAAHRWYASAAVALFLAAACHSAPTASVAMSTPAPASTATTGLPISASASTSSVLPAATPTGTSPAVPTPSPTGLPSGYALQPTTPTAASGYPGLHNPPTPVLPTATPAVAPTVPIAPNAISPLNAASLLPSAPVPPPSFQGATDMLNTLSTFFDPILDIAFSLDGGRLAIAKAYGVFVYDLRTPQPLRFIDTADAIPLRVFFTAMADRLVVSTHEDPRVGPRGATYFDLANGQRSGMIRWPTSVNGIDSTIARLSPDGRILLIQQNFGAVLYDAATLQPLPYWPRAFEAATFAFSPDSQLFATGFGAVTVSDLATSNVVFNATQRGTAANQMPALIFSPDGRVFATTDARRLVVWDVLRRQKLFDVPAPGPAGYWTGAVAIAPNDQMLAAANEGHVSAWRLPSGMLAFEASGTGVLFSPDGVTLLVTMAEHRIAVWDVASGRERLEVAGDAPQFAPDGRLLIRVGAAAYAFADAQSGQVQTAFFAQRPRFAPDGRLVDIGDDASVRILDVTGHLVQAMGLRPQHNTMTSVAFRRGGQLVMAYGNGTVRAQTTDPQLVNNPYAAAEQGGWVYQIAPMPDGATILSASKDGTVARLYGNGSIDLEGQVTFGGQPGELTSVVASPDGLRIAAGSSDGSVKLWAANVEAYSGSVQPWEALPQPIRPAQTLAGHSNWVWSVAFSPDGRQLASGSADQTVLLWDPATGATVRVLTGHTGTVRSVTYSPDGTLVASGAWDGTVRLWDAGTGALVRVLNVGAGRVNQVAFSPDGQTLAAAVDDGTVPLWESATGRSLAVLHPAGGAVWAVAFSPDGRRLAAAMNDGSAQIWEAP